MGIYEKEAEAMDRLSTLDTPQAVYVGHSGGKDSVVVHHLAKKVFGQFVPIIHTPKITGFNKVHPHTIDFIYEMAATHGLQMVPGTRMKEHLEAVKLSIQIDGTRRDESDRADRSSDVVIDGQTISREEMPWITYDGLFGQTSVFPIFDWSDDEVWAYIREEGLEVSAEYNLRATR